MDEKLVSVIIPAYNIEDYIGRCLDSVLSQTYKNLEIIVIDDGSSDRTGEILDDYEKKNHRMKVIHKENGGVSSARNIGIDRANGDYIGFVDGDDRVNPKLFETLVKLINEENADIAHCGYQMVFPDRVDYYYKMFIFAKEQCFSLWLSYRIKSLRLSSRLFLFPFTR